MWTNLQVTFVDQFVKYIIVENKIVIAKGTKKKKKISINFLFLPIHVFFPKSSKISIGLFKDFHSEIM